MTKELLDLLDSRMKQHVGGALQGNQCILGTITANGVKLDDFKHEITDPMCADWELEIEMPAAARVIKTAAPVNLDGSDISGSTAYSEISRLDFNVQGHDVTTTEKVHLNVKAGLQPGDRVLSVPINGGQDCVIICKVVT